MAGTLVEYEVKGAVATVRVNNPPVNALSTRVIDEISEAIRRAESDPGVKAVVLSGAGRTFIAGADIRELERAAWGDGTGGPDAHGLLRQMEDCARPIVVALHGTTLGGGLEVAMAGHYRVAVSSAQMGQPEVNLGIIPGAEGTQRLPRLVGVEKAIETCVTGKPVRAPAALEMGLIDRILEGDMEAGAAVFALEVAGAGGSHPITRDLKERLGDPVMNAPLFEAGRALAKKIRRNQIAPLAAIEAIESATSLPFDEGCRREKEIFARCVTSDQCRAMLHAFFAERAVNKIPELEGVAPRAVDSVAIIGAGTMGGGIAMAAANAGIRVILKDATQDGLDRGTAAIQRNYETSVKRGRFTEEAVAERLALIRPQLDHAGFDTVDLVIEAAFEDMALKKRLFSEIDAVVKGDCVLGTNTSTLDIDEIAGATSRPESVVGLHFFSPANVMRLLEIVWGPRTSEEVLATAMALARRLGKVGVLVKNGPGFVGNRMMFPYMYEAQFLVEEGATPEQVDRALTGFGMAMGIFAVDDMAGIDVAWRVRQALGHFTRPGERKPLVPDRLYELGRFGQKTGKGWYRYDEARTASPDPEILQLIRESAAEAGIAQRSFTDEQIVERTVYALINEGARVLEEGLAVRASDIDVIYLNGYGFPGWRGGPMFFADTVGLPEILGRVREFHREHGGRWKPAPLLERLVAEGRTFRDHDAERETPAPSAPSDRV